MIWGELHRFLHKNSKYWNQEIIKKKNNFSHLLYSALKHALEFELECKEKYELKFSKNENIYNQKNNEYFGNREVEMDTFKKKMLIIFSITLILISAGVGIYFQIATTRTWFAAEENSFLDPDRTDAIKIDFSGDIAFVAYELGGIKIYDYSDTRNPSQIASIHISRGFITDQFLVGDLLYVLNFTNLLIYDISDLDNIQNIGYYGRSAREHMICSIWVQGNVAYLANRASFEILNISDPQNITLLSFTSLRWSLDHDLYYENGLIYYANGARGLYVYDVENPSNPELIAEIENYGYAGSLDMAVEVTVLNKTIYLSDSIHGLVIIDASDIENPRIIGSYSASIPSAVYEEGTNIYVVDQYTGLKTIEMNALPEINVLCEFSSRSGILDIEYHSNSFVLVGERGISVVSIDRGEGRNPAQIARVKQFIPGIYEITGVAFLVIYLTLKLKRTNI